MLSEEQQGQKVSSSKERCLNAGRAVLSVVSGHSLPRNPVPLCQITEADLIGIKDVRAWDGHCSHLFKDDIVKSFSQEHDGDYALKQDGSNFYNILALSGGGANGAFGAGFLYGWTKAGTRPKFKIVTGISTGAIIATLAFLGSEYDDVLKEIYTTVTTSDIYKKRNFITWLWKDSFADTEPLKELIGKYGDENAIKAIAEAHNNGRRLYVATANLDAQRLVVWNMGAIANSDHCSALEVFRKVILASLSVPCIFPPVYFDVQVDGQLYDEMHVDGGMISDAIIYDFMLEFPADGKKEQKPGNAVYIIRNDKLTPSPEQVSRNIRKITRRALSTLNKAHSEDHLRYIYDIARRNHVEFNYIGIPEDSAMPNKLKFDQKEMNRLFDLGVDLAGAGPKWHKTPPNFDGR
jgi:predicted acylesterase/phospholipase RssA